MLVLTPELLAAAYRLLHCSRPFCDWNLPEHDDLTFRVAKTSQWFARFVRWSDGSRGILVSGSCVGTLQTLLVYMAHEMIHLHLDELGYDKNVPTNRHSARFRALAKEACEIHRFDYKAFF
jgi:hypothetical protein